MRIKQKIIALLTVAAVLLGIAGCFDEKSSLASFLIKGSVENAGFVSSSFHSLASVPEINVAASGFTAMSFEPSSAAVCISEFAENCVWSTLPFFENEAASALDVVLRTPDGVYYLNSQDNSIAYGSYNYELTENGVSVDYLIADCAENTSGKISSVSEGVALKITMSYILSDGDLRVSIDCANIELSPNAVLERISLMPYFGAVKNDAESANAQLENAVLASVRESFGVADESHSNAEAETEADNDIDKDIDTETQKDNAAAADDNSLSKSSSESPDYLLVPDGCGAIMYTDTADENTSELTFDVYGSSENSAAIPVFGIKKGSSAFAAVIDDGAAIADIRARRAEKDSSGAATVYPIFTVTEHVEDNGKHVYSQPYDGKISVCYRFAWGAGVDYISMASLCREELIRNGALSANTVGSDEYPLNVSVAVSVDGTSKRTVSTFEDAEDLLQLLKAKGVDSVEMILKGMFSGGLVCSGGDKLHVLRSAGGTLGLQRLYEYAEKQKFKVYAGVTLIKSGGVKSSDFAKDLNGNNIASSVNNPLFPEIGQKEYKVNMIAAKNIEKNTISLMNSAERLPITGLCILDGDIGTYSDSSSGLNAEAVSSMIAKNVSVFSTRKELAVSGVSFNTLGNATILTDMPLTAKNAESNAYKAVPLVPAVIHSTVRYAGTPVNSGTAAQLNLLKCVEYGAQPQYLWVLDEISHYYYEQTFNEAVAFVLRASDELGNLGKCRIVSHSEIEDNVFCTGFDNGAHVYVNYNNYSVIIGDIAVLPYDYIRIN